VHEEWTDLIKDDHPKLMEAIESARHAHSESMGAYMCFMAVRLLAMRRVLKPTGSIYLHCDPTASHYLDVITLPTMASTDKERTGYPTQKPLALYERIIKASSNEGDIVLDPFAGCATTCVAAERLGRQWVGIDLWEKAHEVVVNRLRKEVGLFGDVTFTDELPERTDDGEVAVEGFDVPTDYNIKKEPWQRLGRTAMFNALKEAQSITPGKCLCAGCGRELEPPYMELDHISPQSDRGKNYITNRILLCRPCNNRKGANLTMKGLITANKKIGWMENEKLAKRARDLAEKCANDIRYGVSEKRI